MKSFLTILAAVVISLAAGHFIYKPTLTTNVIEQKTSSQVFEKQKIRCGYQYWDGGLFKDEATGKLKGFMVDYTEKLAANTEMQIEWIGPIDWANITAELNANKIDAWCAGTWLSGKNARFMLVSDPVAYNGFEAFVRGDDTRFDADPNLLNDPSVTLAVIGSTSSAYVAQRILPQAKVFDLPLSATDVEVIMNVATGKADVGFNSPGIVYQYMQENPGKVKRLRPDQPYALMGVTYTVKQGEWQLHHLLNTAIKELDKTGYTQKLITQYNAEYPGLFATSDKLPSR
ncbi:MAG: transporter substrate-binding domain-containing protein [Alphaproteobacteria bacterium]|nr:transporter substrate-binding domain-containing protein [Alphaproteobacteria bacterium]